MAALLAEWLQEHRQISSSAAFAQVQVAIKLSELPRTAEAFAKGLISAQHASVICRAMDELHRLRHPENARFSRRPPRGDPP